MIRVRYTSLKPPKPIPRGNFIVAGAIFDASDPTTKDAGRILGVLYDTGASPQICYAAKSLREPPQYRRFSVCFTGVRAASYQFDLLDAEGMSSILAARIAITVNHNGVSSKKHPPAGGYPSDPQIDFPTDTGPYCSSAFIAYGVRSAAPIANATLTDVNSGEVTEAVYIYDDPGTGFWYAEFPDMNDGTYDLAVSNTDQTNPATTQSGVMLRANMCSP